MLICIRLDYGIQNYPNALLLFIVEGVSFNYFVRYLPPKVSANIKLLYETPDSHDE